jgi:small subunit ribosomal protein S1
VVRLDEEIECVVIGVDKEDEKISLGLKQKTPSPWENVENRYPLGGRVRGTVVSIMNYGVFVRLEEGIEGLVHISEMSWTKRLSHPGEMVNINDEIEVVVLNVNKQKREISLGLKQTEINPWTIASQKYPAGTIISTSVHSITNFGVFVEVEPGIDGMIHISDLSWTKKFNHPSEMLQKGQDIKCVVLEVNEQKRRISLGIKQMAEDPWIRAIPEKYIPGQIIKGTITKLTNFGAFVELEPDLEGLLHISELADHKIDKPQDVVKLGEEVEVKILRIDPESRKIGLSLRRARWAAEEHAAEAAKPEDQPADTLLGGVEQAPTTEPVAEEKTEDQETQQPEDQEAQQPEGLEPKEQPEAEQQAEEPVAQADEGEVEPSKESEQVPSPPQEPADEEQAEEPVAQADEGEVEPSKESEQVPSPPQEPADEQQVEEPVAQADEGEVEPSKESEQVPSPPQEPADEEQAEEPVAQADEGEIEPSKESEQTPSPPQEPADEQQTTAPEAEAKDKTDTDNQ